MSYDSNSAEVWGPIKFKLELNHPSDFKAWLRLELTETHERKSFEDAGSI